MKLIARIPVSAALLALALTSTGCNQLRARDHLNKGVAAFKNAQYEVAVDHFQKAAELDPNYANAKLYLATAYSYQVVPGLDTPENKALAQKAIDGFQQVLDKDPNDLTALKQIASLDRNTGKMTEAKDYERKVIAASPNDAEAYYTLGQIDWSQAYKSTLQILADDGMHDDGVGNLKKSKGACQKLVTANTAFVNEGLEYLQKAIDVNPTYDDAMTYMNLMLRQKANLECGDPAAVKADLAKADEWVKKGMDARKINEKKKEEKAGGGVQM